MHFHQYPVGNVAHFLEITVSQALVKNAGQKSKHQVGHNTHKVQLVGKEKQMLQL